MYDSVLALSRTASVAGGSQESLLRSPPPLVEFLPIGLYACDASGRVCWFNQVAAQLWGRAPLIGDDSERFCGSYRLYSLDGWLIRREETPMAAALRTGEPVVGGEARVERPDGSHFVAMVHINPIKDEHGNVVGAINAFHDVSESKERDRRMRERERQFRELLDSLPAAIYTTDAAGRITYYNEAAATLAGRRPTIGVDEWCVTWRLRRPDGSVLPHPECPMAIALREARPVRGVEAIAERPDGTLVPFIPFPTPLHDSAGNLVGAVNMLIDISHRKEAETQQRVMCSELNHRTKNNIQMLHALLAAARRETASPDAKAALGEAMQRVGAMAAAQAVLYQANNAEWYAAESFLKAVCGTARQALGQEIEIQWGPGEGRLSNDTAVPLALIVNELVTNAVKYGVGDRGEGSIRIALFQDDGEFVLRVEDDGPGFELSETKRRSSGLGLVMGLVRQIGGTFSVERAGGARCTVRFPEKAAAQ